MKKLVADRALDEWAPSWSETGPYPTGMPVENAYIESFNGKLKEECLNLQWFKTIEVAKEKFEACRIDRFPTAPTT